MKARRLRSSRSPQSSTSPQPVPEAPGLSEILSLSNRIDFAKYTIFYTAPFCFLPYISPIIESFHPTYFPYILETSAWWNLTPYAERPSEEGERTSTVMRVLLSHFVLCGSEKCKRGERVVSTVLLRITLFY